ncbi:putative alanine acetyltransferase [Candidatus Fokinia solitaria]|uniref:Putative alanine acetyltransferase n=1 Tax=Candidatus Fokinia solitaria TaxID=1802984 RepID=A0A2U8BSR7_9RICK|nr:GNAT family protein [Candidatus Fokinia solitaria]AWD33382.1 putative alanine acetyltransferase [Candidatus Fokinia solitaria]
MKKQNIFAEFPTIEIGEIVLRELSTSDYKRYYEIYTDPRVAMKLSDEDMPKSERDAMLSVIYWRDLFHRSLSVFWGITIKETDFLIGTIGFFDYNVYSRKAEICYDLDPNYWRRGIMKRAIIEVLNFGFNVMDLYRISAKTLHDNQPSLNLLHDVGFQEEGVMRGYRLIRGGFPDIKMLSLLPHEFRHRRR